MERILIVFALALAGVVVFWLFKQWQMRRMTSAVIGTTSVNGSQRAHLLYFGSENCAACPTQTRYVEAVANQWADAIEIETIDAEADPEKASRFGVFTLPTTILVDTAGKVREINYGLTNAHKLNQQLQTVLHAAS